MNEAEGFLQQRGQIKSTCEADDPPLYRVLAFGPVRWRHEENEVLVDERAKALHRGVRRARSPLRVRLRRGEVLKNSFSPICTGPKQRGVALGEVESRQILIEFPYCWLRPRSRSHGRSGVFSQDVAA